MSPIRPNRGLVREALTASGNPVGGTVTDDGGGGATVADVAGSAVPCRIDPLGGSESEVAGRISDRSTHLVTLPAETSITVADDFSISGTAYEVTAVRDSTDEFARFIEVVART